MTTFTLAPVVLPMRLVAHVHIESESRDCDGRYSRESVWAPGKGDSGRDLFTWLVRHELDFLGSGVVERSQDADGRPCFEVRENTDEGWRITAYTGCDDVRCDTTHTRRRDHAAEAAGY